MNRVTSALLLVLTIEVAVGAVLVTGRLRLPSPPPEPDCGLLDPATVADLRADVAAGCRTAADWRALGERYMAAGCFRESEQCHRAACETAPSDGGLLRQWGFALERLGLLTEANAAYQKAIDAGGTDPDACRYLIARNHLRSGDTAAARTVFAAGQELAANRHELARLLRRAGELTEAESLLGTLTTPPDTLQANHLGYRLALDRGDLGRAAVFADRARYSPAKLQNPFDEEAAQVLAATQDLGPTRRWKEVRARIEAGDLDGAAARLDRDADAARESGGIELRAELAARRGRYAEAADRLAELERVSGCSARIAARLGEVWAEAGDPEKARASWLRAAALEAGADLKRVHHMLARSFAAAGDAASAEYHLARGHYFVGRDILHTGHPAPAVNYFAAAVKHDPTFVQAWFYLGDVSRLTGGRAAAEAAYRECLRLNPDHGRARASLRALGVTRLD